MSFIEIALRLNQNEDRNIVLKILCKAHSELFFGNIPNKNEMSLRLKAVEHAFFGNDMINIVKKELLKDSK